MYDDTLLATLVDLFKKRIILNVLFVKLLNANQFMEIVSQYELLRMN